MSELTKKMWDLAKLAVDQKGKPEGRAAARVLAEMVAREPDPTLEVPEDDEPFAPPPPPRRRSYEDSYWGGPTRTPYAESYRSGVTNVYIHKKAV